MKNVFINLGIVIVGYICFSVANMATVLLLFRGLGLDAQILSSLILVLGIETIIISVSSYWIFKGTLRFSRGNNKRLSSYILLSLLIAITVLNIYLNQSIEPLAYKLLYVVVIITALIIHKPWQNRKG